MDGKQMLRVVGCLAFLSVLPSQAATIGALVDGQITSLTVKEGDKVAKGQALLTIDSRALQATLNQIKAKLRLAELELKDAKIDLEAEKALFDQSATAKRRYEASLLLRDRASARVDALRAELNEAQAKLVYHDIVAPIDGVVTKLWVQLGDTVFHENMKMIEIEAKP